LILDAERPKNHFGPGFFLKIISYEKIFLSGKRGRNQKFKTTKIQILKT